MEKREVRAGWLFLLGSGLLVIDAINENLNEVSLASLLHLSGGLLFFFGSYFAIPKAGIPKAGIPKAAIPKIAIPKTNAKPQDNETKNKP